MDRVKAKTAKPRLTRAQSHTKVAITQWVERTLKRKVTGVRHIHPVAYVVAKMAPMCLLVAVPWETAESQVRSHTRLYPYETLRLFHEDLATGSFCQIAYVCSNKNGSWSQEHVAIPLEAPDAR